MQLTSILPLEAVLPNLPARDKKQALKMMAAQASTLTGIPDRDIFAALIEREHIGCTGMGNGVCIPHARFEGLKNPLAVFARLERPIEFGAADGKPVDIIFLLLTPTSANTDHIKALAVATRLLRDKKLCKDIRALESADAIHNLLIAERGEDAA